MTQLELNKKVFFNGEKLPMNVRAFNEMYAICSRPINRREDADMIKREVEMGAYGTFTEAWEANKDNYIYSILDLKEMVKGSDNLVFGRYNYSIERDCKKALNALMKGGIEISHRNRAYFSFDTERTLPKRVKLN